MDKTDKPAWMKSFEDTYSAPVLPGYWNKPLKGKEAEAANGGYKMADGGGRGGHSETSSLYSRYTSSDSERSERKRSRRLTLCIILTVVAFIIALLVGLLVYFLFMTDRPKHGGAVAGVGGSVRVLNMTYDDAMANTSSQAFRDVAEPFCAELDAYVANSNYSGQYEECSVVALRNVADVSDCLCLGAKKGSVMVDFQLRFNGSHEEVVLKKDIFDVIERGVTKLRFGDVIYVLLKHFLVDIRYDWNMPYDAIEADVTLPVYNLNYSRALSSNQSREFLALARPFCSEVDGILTNEKLSWLAPRYTSCHVTDFAQQSSDKGSVSFTLKFDGRDPRPLQQGLLYILLTGARDVEWYGQQLKMIGSLVVTPFGATNQLRPVNETIPPPSLTYVSVTLPVFNLTLTPELGDPQSIHFINITTRFCDDMAEFYKRSGLEEKFYSCKVLGFRPDETRIEFKLGFRGDAWAGLDQSVVMVIRNHGPDRMYGTLHLYRVGDLDVILDRVTANGLELHTSFPVVNLTYISALEDPGSPEFLDHAVLFCKDLGEFYKKSSFADRFVHCGVKAFTPRPVKVHFFLIFEGTTVKGLTSSHIDVIRRYGKQVYLTSGWTAYLVGDLLVLPDGQGHSVYPTNITHTSTATTSSQTVIATSTVFPEGDMTRATITGHLYNFTFGADLLDASGDRFKSLEKNFCDAVGRVYLKSFLFLTYRGCKIDHFSPSPDEVKFSLYFDAKVSRDLEWGIQYVLTNDSPKVNLTLNDLHLVEVLHLGDLYLTLREITLEPTPSTSFPMPSTSEISPTTVMTEMTSTIAPTTTSGAGVITSTVVIPPSGTNVTLSYPLFNITYPTGLGDPTKEIFKEYQRRFCLQVQDVFKASRVFYLLYDGCGINAFRYDANGQPYVSFHLLFNTGFTDLLFQTTVDTFEKSRPHLYVNVNETRVYEILPLGGLQLILENRTASSSILTSSMTQTVGPSSTAGPSVSLTSVRYGGVVVALYYETYKLNYTSDLKNTNSARFLDHRQKVCSDLESWFRDVDSPFYLTYHGCELSSFSSSPEGVTFLLTLRTDMTPDIARHVRTFLEYKAPKRFVPLFNLLEVGNLDLIVDRYSIDASPIPLPSDSFTIFTTSAPTSSPTISMTMTSSTIEPTPTSSSVMPSSTVFPVQTVVSLQFGLADFEFTDDLNYPFSQLFRYLQDTFCKDIEQFYKSSSLSPYYRTCQIDRFIESPRPNQPHKVTFTLSLEMPYSQELVDLTVDTLLTQEPQINLDGYVTIRVGELYLILSDWKNVSPPNTSQTSGLPTLTLTATYTTAPTPSSTIAPTPTSSAMASSSAVIATTPSTTTVDPTYYLRMSFELANMTWHPDLNVSTSEQFTRHNKLFCAELNEFLPGQGDKDFRHYMGCNIDNFSGQPLRVNFSLEFDTLDGLNIDRVQRFVISYIKEYAVRHTVGSLMVYQIGDLLIDLDSVYIHNDTSITTLNVFDAIAYEHVYRVSPGNFSAALLDKTSYEFQSRSYEFCKDIDSVFTKVGIRNIRQRYTGCYVNQFRNGPSPNVTFTLVFSGTEVIDPERLTGILVFSRQQEGQEFFRVGDLSVASTSDVKRYFLMLDMMSTQSYPYTTTPVPAVVTRLQIKLRALTPEWTPELGDPTSSYFLQMEQGFCDDVSVWIKAEKRDYQGCKLTKISEEPMIVEAELRFVGGGPSSALRYEVDTILLESPDWEIFGNVIGLRMGGFYIYEESLLVDLLNATTTAPVVTTPISVTTTAPTPTRPTNPCLLGGDFYRHPTLCDRFLQCAGDFPIEIPCGPGSVYLDRVCKTPAPDFQCTPLV